MSVNKKGYTLIEVLATIVILGLLSALGIVTVNSVVSTMHENHFHAQEKSIVMAAKSFSEDNRFFLPKKIGEKRQITVEQLQQTNYLGKVLGYDKKECTKGYVTIFKYGKEMYSYKPYLKCTKYETSMDQYGGEGPVIALDVNAEINNPNFSFTITSNDDSKIIGYNYIIYKYGVEALNSGSVATSRVSKVEKNNISIKNIVPGQFKLVIKATNNYGVTREKETEFKVIGIEGPICGKVEPKITSWNNTPNVKVSVQCIDKGGSGCKQDTFTRIFTKNAIKNFIEIEDKLGNKTNCLVNTYLDNVKPSKPVITNNFNNIWYNDAYTIQVESSDETSGIESLEYKYEYGSWTTIGNFKDTYVEKHIFDINIPKENINQKLYVRVKDRAGNYSSISSTNIKVDIDKPEKVQISNIYNNMWVNFDYNIILKYIDKFSGIKKLQYRYAGEEWKDYGEIEHSPNIEYSYATPKFNFNSSKTYEVRSCDYADNCSDINTTTIKIDKIPPVIKNIFNSKNGKATYDNVKLQATLNDDLSGVNKSKVYYTYDDVSNTKMNDLTVSTDKVYGIWKGVIKKKVYFIVYDNAGNKSEADIGIINIVRRPAPSPSSTPSNNGGGRRRGNSNGGGKKHKKTCAGNPSWSGGRNRISTCY